MASCQVTSFFLLNVALAVVDEAQSVGPAVPVGRGALFLGGLKMVNLWSSYDRLIVGNLSSYIDDNFPKNNIIFHFPIYF